MTTDTARIEELYYPSVDPGAFASKQTGESLPSMVQNSQDVIRLLDMRTTNPSQEVLSEAEQRAIRMAAVCVTDCLEFSPTELPWTSTEVGNCYSYTWLIGETARSLGFTSLIAFTNDHAFNLITSQTAQNHVINGESRHMWFFDTERHPVTSTIDALAKPKQSADGPVAYSRLDTTELRIFNGRYAHPAGRARRRLPWLEDLLPAMALMDQEAGRHALYYYSAFVDAIRTSDLNATDGALDGLMIVNPQAETRDRINNGLKIFGKSVNQWLRDGHDTESLVSIVQKYEKIMPETKGMSIHVGNWLRSIGQARSDVEVLRLAKDHYDEAEALGQIKGDPMLDGKKRKTAEAIRVASRLQN